MNSLRPSVFIALLVTLSLGALFFELGRMDVVTDNEGQRAAPPAEMLRSGDFLIPTLNGKVYLAKPPLLYWMIAGVYAAAGEIDELYARVPTAVCGVALMLSVYLAFRKRLSEDAARYAALGALAAPYILERSRIAELDIPLVLTTFWTVMFAQAAWTATTSAQRARWASFAGIALAAAAMLKGPVPFLFLGGAFVAHAIVESPRDVELITRGARWSALAILIGFVLYGITLLGALQQADWSLPFPLALVLYAGAWLWLTVRLGGAAAKRALPVLGLTLVVAVLFIAPYGAAVILREGWGFVSHLLHSEVLDRTHTATHINSGSPFYYLLVLPFMIAPLGLLLPIQFSTFEWKEGGPEYRFAVLMPWISIGLFSLIAGKEYEYILPCLPVMLGAIGWNVARGTGGLLVDWEERWFKLLLRVLRYGLAFGGAGIVVYALVTSRNPLLWAETAALGLLAVVLLLTQIDPRLDKPARVCLAVTAIVLAGLNIRSFHYQGHKSPKELARLCGDLARAGVAIESSKIFPAFTYYAEHDIPEVTDPATVQAKLEGTTPYFFLTLNRFVEQFGAAAKPKFTSEKFGPKDLVLLGNRDPKEVLPAPAP